MENDDISPEKILRMHFPAYPWTPESLAFEASFLTPPWLMAGGLTMSVDATKVRDDLDQVEQAIKNLWKHYKALPRMLTRGGTQPKRDEDGTPLHYESTQQRIATLYHDLTGIAPPLFGAMTNQAAKKTWPKKTGEIARIKRQLESAYQMHHHARDSGAAAKVQLAMHCADVWRKCMGAEPPTNANDGTAYHKFVADVIQLAGMQDKKGWSVRSVLGQYKRYTEATE